VATQAPQVTAFEGGREKQDDQMVPQTYQEANEWHSYKYVVYTQITQRNVEQL
jgi:hypothetical protein